MIAKIIFILNAALISIEAAGLSAYSSGSIPPYNGHGISALGPAISSYYHPQPVVAASAIPAYHAPAIAEPAFASFHAPAIAAPAIPSYHAPAISSYHTPALPSHPIPSYSPEIAAFHSAPVLPPYHSAPLTGFVGPIGPYASSYGHGSLGGRYAF